jgi:NADH:ubiquinone oxidoreductase subunit F (NADH-binding)
MPSPTLNEADPLRAQAGFLGDDMLGSGRASASSAQGAGAYVCGEETALLESLEGRAASCAPSRRCRRIAGLFGSRPSSTT